MNTAKFVKKLDRQASGNAAVYHLSTPYKYEIMYNVQLTNYVVCSTANTSDHGWETMVFPTDKDGEVIDWCNLACRRNMDELDHKFVLLDIGYELETGELKN